MAVAASRGELTVEVVAASEVAWFDAQLAERHYLGAGRPVGDYRHIGLTDLTPILELISIAQKSQTLIC